jgi:peptidoglycan/LPS O-acetylase OafA/YrhL
MQRPSRAVHVSIDWYSTFCLAPHRMHPQAHFLVWRLGLLPSGLVSSADDLAGFVVDAAASVLVTFGIAFLSYRLVEQPALKVARRLEHTLFAADSSSYVQPER